MSQLKNKISNKKIKVGIIGLGYVGLPLANAFIESKVSVIGFDIDKEKVELLNKGESYIKHIENNQIKSMISKNFVATNDFSMISNLDSIIICVPTPLNKKKEPDLSAVINTAETIKKFLKKNQLVVLESSTYPGTTDEVVGTILEKSGFKLGTEFHLAYSPEREDPGNKDFGTRTIPKIVGANDAESLEIAVSLYKLIIDEVIPVNSLKIAEASKLTENIFRSVNIALVNELKVIYEVMGIDIWDVIDAASSKPFGYMAFYPGPGLGGHCIPVDPFYLAYKAKQFGAATKFIELAGEINTAMPYKVLEKVFNDLGEIKKNKNVLVVGLAYKKDVDDYRESPSLVIMDALEKNDINVFYHDSYIPIIKRTRDFDHLTNKKSVDLSIPNIKKMDIILILTDHSYIDYQVLADEANTIIDTRNSMNNINGKAKIIKA